jgi:hypothetical protein
MDIVVNNNKELKALYKKYKFVFVPSAPGEPLTFPVTATVE